MPACVCLSVYLSVCLCECVAHSVCVCPCVDLTDADCLLRPQWTWHSLQGLATGKRVFSGKYKKSKETSK